MIPRLRDQIKVPAGNESNKRAAAARRNIVLRDFRKRVAIHHLERLVFPTQGFRGGQALERLVGVDKRHAKRVGDMLLSKRELSDVAFRKTDLLGAHKQMKQQIGDALERGAPADAQKMLV